MYYKLIECMHCVSYVFVYSIFLHDHSQRIQANLILWSFCTYFFSVSFFCWCSIQQCKNVGKGFIQRSSWVTEQLLKSYRKNGILLQKLFWPTVRKNCSSDREKLFKFKAESREFSKILRSLKQFVQTVKGQNNIW